MAGLKTDVKHALDCAAEQLSNRISTLCRLMRWATWHFIHAKVSDLAWPLRQEQMRE